VFATPVVSLYLRIMSGMAASAPISSNHSAAAKCAACVHSRLGKVRAESAWAMAANSAFVEKGTKILSCGYPPRTGRIPAVSSSNRKPAGNRRVVDYVENQIREFFVSDRSHAQTDAAKNVFAVVARAL
jgi:hypothetical protein